MLKNYDAIFPILTIPEFPAHIIVDYLSSDGSVTHLFPTRASPDRVFHANASVPLGDSAKGVGGGVGPPFGTDMIIAIASSIELFPDYRLVARYNTVETYLPVLQGAIEAARGHGARLAGTALAFETVP
jgi:serine/threonine-protein kinase